MTDARESCPSCGTPVTSFVEGRLCPACLLRLAADEAAEGDDPGAGRAGAERYVVRAVIDDCAEATAYLADDLLSATLVRLEVGKRAAAGTSAGVAVGAASAGGVVDAGMAGGQATAGAPGLGRDDPRVLDSGCTADGRPWIVTTRDAFGAGVRGWVLAPVPRPLSST